jgi:subtilisin family serine protease
MGIRSLSLPSTWSATRLLLSTLALVILSGCAPGGEAARSCGGRLVGQTDLLNRVQLTWSAPVESHAQGNGSGFVITYGPADDFRFSEGCVLRVTNGNGAPQLSAEIQQLFTVPYRFHVQGYTTVDGQEILGDPGEGFVVDLDQVSPLSASRVVASQAETVVTVSRRESVAGLRHSLALKAADLSRPHDPNSILVRTRSGLSTSERGAVIGSLESSERPRRLPRLGARDYQIHIPEGGSVAAALAEAWSHPDVEFAQPNYIYRIGAVPNDVYFPGNSQSSSYDQLWSLYNRGNAVQSLATLGGDDDIYDPQPLTSPRRSKIGTSGRDLNMRAAWDRRTDCRGVPVAVIDTGVDRSHSDLVANLTSITDANRRGRNTIAGQTATNYEDDNGHGTHVMGTIAAVGNNGIGSVGVCWQADVMAVKAISSNGEGSTADVATGIRWAVDNGAKVLNMSLGVYGADPAVQSAVTYAQGLGVVIVAAASNDGLNNDEETAFPCSAPNDNVVCVAALDQSYGLADFSNFGKQTVDVGAPGVNVLSTWPFREIVTSVSTATGWTTSGAGFVQAFNANSFFNCGSAPCFGGGFLAFPGTWNWNQGASSYYPDLNTDQVTRTIDKSTDSDFASYPSAGDQLTVRGYLTYSMGGGGTPDAMMFRARQGNAQDPFSVACPSCTESQWQAAGIYSRVQFSGQDSLWRQGLQLYELPIAADCLASGGQCTIGFKPSNPSGSTGNGFIFGEADHVQKKALDNQYMILNGTSMAAPHVAGLAALIWAENPSYTYRDVVSALRGSGLPQQALEGKTSTGRSVDARRALGWVAPIRSLTVRTFP